MSLLKIVKPEVVRIDPLMGFDSRDRIRPLNLQQSDYDNEYDFTTFWYDAFFSPDGKWAIIIAPPMFGMKGGQEIYFHSIDGIVLPHKIVTMDRNTNIYVYINNVRHTSIAAVVNNYKFIFVIGRSYCNIFSQMRVLLLKSQNNNLAWVKDNVSFHIKYHGATSVLLYDHGSNKYSLDELLLSINEAGSLASVIIVDWKFPFGPPAKIGTSTWDSDFCQYGILEHARWRFLAAAKSVLNIDVDELVFSKNSCSIFDLTEKNENAYLSFYGKWSYACENDIHSHGTNNLNHTISHSSHVYTRKTDFVSESAAKKWCAVPRKIAWSNQWSVHGIYGAIPKICDYDDITIRHCWSLTSLSYKYISRAPFKESDSFLFELDNSFQQATSFLQP